MKTKETSKFKVGDTIMCIKSFWNAETQTQVKEGYIVKNMAQFDIDCLSHPECWKKVESTREQALAWWNNLPHEIQGKHWFKFRDNNFTPSTNPSNLTGREIEEIWNKEVNGECSKCKQTVQNCECHISLEEKHKGLFQMHKILPKLLKEMNPNQKQFKQFDESLHKAYLNKFSEEDKFKAFLSNLDELSEEVQFNAFLAILKKMNLDSQTQSNIMTLVALRDI